MKRLLVLCAALGGLLLIAYGSADAQVKFGFGPRLGFNLGGMSFDPDLSQDPNYPGVTKTGRFGMMFGAAGELEFARMFAAEVGIIYVMKGGGYDQKSQNATGTLDDKINELQFPILFKVKIPVGTKFRPYGFVGPNLGIVLSATQVGTNAAGTREVDLKNIPGVGSVMSGMDFSLDFGAGAEYLIAHNIGLQADLRYSLGLSNIYSPPTAPAQPGQAVVTPSWKTHGFQVLFGMMFYP